MSKATVIVHGGAGTASADQSSERVSGCERAAKAGASALSNGALAAAVAAVRVLEDDPNFNAGLGSTLTRDGTVELDAAVMTGDLRFGAIAAVPPVAAPILLALEVMRSNEHCLLSGEGALAFAREAGIEILDPETYTTDRARQALAEATKIAASGERVTGTGTVGAVAVDRDGNLAAATSTGGILYKRIGRIGDTPMPGGGTYADGELGGAASATGEGEAIMRSLLCRAAVQALSDGLDPQRAGEKGLEALERRVGGKAGLILVNRVGEVWAGKNTDSMPWASCTIDGRLESGN